MLWGCLNRVKILLSVAFSQCRKAEDGAVGHVNLCKPPPRPCGGVNSNHEAKEDMRALEEVKGNTKKVFNQKEYCHLQRLLCTNCDY